MIGTVRSAAVWSVARHTASVALLCLAWGCADDDARPHKDAGGDVAQNPLGPTAPSAEAGTPDSDAMGGDADAGSSECAASGIVTLTVDTPTKYACHQPYAARLTLANDSCTSVTIDHVVIRSTNLSGPCRAPDAYTAEPSTSVVASSKTQIILDFIGRKFCCAAEACQPSRCEERQDFTVATSIGELSLSASIVIDFGKGCSEQCR
jgi:hypothetical protein